MVVELDIKRSASHTRMASDVDEKVAARHRAGSAENEGAVARYVAECDRYRLAPDPAVVTTLATGWWLLEPSRPYGAGGLLPLVAVLADATTPVTELRLRAQSARPTVANAADARALAELLRANATLETLDCGACGLDDVAVAEVAAGAAASRSLRVLKLGLNYTFGDHGCRALADAIHGADQCKLELVDLSNNGLYFPGVSRVVRAVSRRGGKVDAVGNYTTEELLSALTHGFSFLVALVGTIPLLSDAYMLDRTTFWACALYAATLLICFGSSTCYHAHFSNPYLMMIWQRIDHMGIYLLIAGSYTVLLFVGCRGSYRVVAVTILEWVAAFIGCIVSAAGVGVSKTETNVAELVTFALMGGAAVPVMPAVKSRMQPEALFLVALGGLFYLVGIWPFTKSHPGWHVVWHLFVMAGAATHFFCVWLYILPMVGESGGFDFSPLDRDDLREAVSDLRTTMMTASIPDNVLARVPSLQTALVSHLLFANASTAAALADEYRRAMGSRVAELSHGFPDWRRARFPRLSKQWDRLPAVLTLLAALKKEEVATKEL